MTTLSASSISTWEECHLQWYFEYVEMLPQAPNEPRETGIFVHDMAERLLVNPGDFDAYWAAEVYSPDAGNLVALFREAVLPTYGNAVLVEAAFELDVDGVPYTGFIDAVDVREGAALMWSGPEVGSLTVLRDLKTTKGRPRPGKYRDALIGYHLGARELGHEPDAFLLDYLVRTQKPYYWPEWQEVPDEDEIDAWATKVEITANGIARGDYDATGLGTYVCNYCPFKDICGPYDRYHRLTKED